MTLFANVTVKGSVVLGRHCEHPFVIGARAACRRSQGLPSVMDCTNADAGTPGSRLTFSTTTSTSMRE
jgi:hypothetical protein